MRVLYVFAVSVLLGGCGGGEADPPTSSTSPAAAAPPCTPVPVVAIQLFGDSTQAGYDGDDPDVLAVHTPTVALQAELDARFGRGTTLVTNRGVSGTTAVELVAGTDQLNQPWPRSVAADVVVVNHGINDLTHYGDLPTYKAALQTLAVAPARVIFETPLQVYGADTTPYADAMRAVAAEQGIPVADVNLLPFSTTLLGDWAHPTDAGYINIVKQALAPVVATEVARLRCE